MAKEPNRDLADDLDNRRSTNISSQGGIKVVPSNVIDRSPNQSKQSTQKMKKGSKVRKNIEDFKAKEKDCKQSKGTASVVRSQSQLSEDGKSATTQLRETILNHTGNRS